MSCRRRTLRRSKGALPIRRCYSRTSLRSSSRHPINGQGTLGPPGMRPRGTCAPGLARSKVWLAVRDDRDRLSVSDRPSAPHVRRCSSPAACCPAIVSAVACPGQGVSRPPGIPRRGQRVNEANAARKAASHCASAARRFAARGTAQALRCALRRWDHEQRRAERRKADQAPRTSSVREPVRRTGSRALTSHAHRRSPTAARPTDACYTAKPRRGWRGPSAGYRMAARASEAPLLTTTTTGRGSPPTPSVASTAENPSRPSQDHGELQTAVPSQSSPELQRMQP